MTDFHGTFVWYELMTTDMKGAEAFYPAVFGWSAADSGMEGMKYTLFSSGDARVAGLMDIPPEAAAMNVPPNWTGYIATDDVDATARKIKELGGSVLREPDEIPGIGRFAVVADPYGAVFCIFKGAGEPPPMPAPNTPGLISWRELHAGDGPGAFEFYSEIFGWTKGEAMDMGPMGVYQIYGKNGTDFGGIMTKTADMPVSCWIYYVQVEDIDAAHKRIGDNGGKVLFGPQEVPGGIWIVQFLDPQGALIAMVGPRKA
jgi:uncharacterized protein